jgi:hypothetical protein
MPRRMIISREMWMCQGQYESPYIIVRRAEGSRASSRRLTRLEPKAHAPRAEGSRASSRRLTRLEPKAHALE